MNFSATMLYLNPGGHNWGPKNYDGYAISTVAVGVFYSILFYAACFYLWSKRDHDIVRMRKVGLALMSLFVLHVYLFMVFMVYYLNGSYPCNVEFWTMSIYLPVGIGLFQAQNQQLFIVSKEQKHLLRNDSDWKPMYPKKGGIGGPGYWVFRFKAWWNNASQPGTYEGLVFGGICVQFGISLAIFCLSRKFSSYGIFSERTSPGLCRRGWEWLPSIVWQFLWNYFFGPYLLWKIHGIHDIYHWRLQTIMAIVAGIPGTPLWLAGVYSNSFASINKVWAPAMWLAPGLVTMELTTLIFPIVQIYRHDRQSQRNQRDLDAFNSKRQPSTDGSTVAGSIATRSTDTKRNGRMCAMETLDECLKNNYDDLQRYASCQEFNGENIIFLVKVLNFRSQWEVAYRRCTDLPRVRLTLFRTALSIFITLIQHETANYPINIESHIYSRLMTIFGQATELVATPKRASSIISTPSSHVTPWDEPPSSPHGDLAPEAFKINTTPPMPMTTASSISNESSEHIIASDEVADPLAGFNVPMAFDQRVFDDAFKSIKYMVWTETWQRYMGSKRNSIID